MMNKKISKGHPLPLRNFAYFCSPKEASMLELLQSIDEALFLFFNNSLQNSFFDWFMPIMRNKRTWIPFYLVFIILIVWKLRWKGVIAVFFVGLAAGLCDYTSSSIVKPLVDRLRPCNDPVFAEQVRLLVSCGSGKSFTSSHATNHFGLAIILTLIFGQRYRWVGPVTILWAATVSFAQIYVGVHYPLDILGGAWLGAMIAFVVSLGYRKLPLHYRVD